MTNLFTTGSILAAFFAGGVALFAPCRIVFLAPSYISGARKNRPRPPFPLTFRAAPARGCLLRHPCVSRWR